MDKNLARMFKVEHVRRLLQDTKDIETLRSAALRWFEHCEAERQVLLQMARPARSVELPNVPRF
jgi:hypothetical protein